MAAPALSMDLAYVERVYVTPTAFERYYPTSFDVSDSYYVPTARVTASYYPTAFVDETVAYPTTTVYERQYRRGLIGSLLFGRTRLVERSVVTGYPSAYVPSSWTVARYSPTTFVSSRTYVPSSYELAAAWDTSYAARSSSPCDTPCETVTLAPRSQGVVETEPSAPSFPVERRAESAAPVEESIPSYVAPAARDAAPTDLSPADEPAKPKAAAAAAEDAASPPKVPVATKPAGESGAGAGAGGGAAAQPALTEPAPIKDTAKPVEKSKVAAPKAPAGDAPADDGVEPAPRGASTTPTGRRVVAKPVNPVSPVVAGGLRPERRNILFGKVESSRTNQPEEEVRVIVSSRTSSGLRREGMSDAYGRFAIKLSEGDWTVNVATPSGRIYPVSQITVTNGRIYDQREQREVPSLIITR
jgi:hypothetical protein